MKVEFRESFAKDLNRIKDIKVRSRVRKVVLLVESARSLNQIPNLKKLAGANDLYRIRVGDYRIGLSLSRATVAFVRILDRKEIYRYFS